jgi:mannose-1-phosphate guanylyltransferase
VRKCAVILAGGSGTRLWPLSRRNRPKQLLRIVGGRSLLHEAYQRLDLMFPPSDIYVVALAEHLPAISLELPKLPSENFIGEPTGRDTANAIALAASILHERSPETLMGVFTADHVIRPADKFIEVIRRGFEAAEKTPDGLVTFGIKPTEPHTGLGYIHRGEPVSPGVWAVKGFKEKPDLDTARQYVASSDYYWNSGMFVWRTAAILEQLRLRLPQSHEATQRLARVWYTEQGQKLAAELYPGLTKISIDFAVMERAPKVLAVEMALEWLDLGSWTALAAISNKDSSGNARALQRTAAMFSRNNIVVAEDEHLIALVGVENLVVVHSGDATLVCHKNQIQQVKELVAELDREYGGLYA